MATYTAIASKCVFTATIRAGSQATLIDVCRHFTINTDIISMCRCVWISKVNQCFITVFFHSYTINILDHGDPRGQEIWRRRDPRVEAELDRGIRNPPENCAAYRRYWRCCWGEEYLKYPAEGCLPVQIRLSSLYPGWQETQRYDPWLLMHSWPGHCRRSSHSFTSKTHIITLSIHPWILRWDEMRWQIGGSHHESPFAKFIKAPFTHALIWAHSEI